ncbi:MAG: penicillin-binding protein 2 [Cyanobacteria bacterium CRU_2_1]|nr:penicillin-binding protein 2 [Cyanobacteria bacterium RU_5_0]NJR59549.1 penicillin-binding protein 2 [Cyanobacteria bacterium CRU_2_1]
MASGLPSSSDKYSVNTSLVKNPSSRDILLWRAVFLMLGITIVMGICIYRLAQLQLIDGQQNFQLAEQNRVRPIPLLADRGNIVDRNGKLLATNRLSRGVYLWPRQQSPAQWRLSATRLSVALGIPAEEILERLEQTGYDSPLPVRISQQITPAAFVALAEQQAQLPGVEVLAGSTRFYPYNSFAAHIIGYIGEATEADMKAHPEYPNGMIVGQMGIERLANVQLQGKWGQRLVEVNAKGQEIRLLGVQSAVGGNDVKLTIDLDLQQAAEKALNGRRGAVVVLDVNTGAVLVLASSPTFDPSVFTRRVSQEEWQRFQQGDQPFLNRALQGYPPGSTFKIVTATAGIQSGSFSSDSVIMTSAFITLGNHQFWESSRQGFGAIGFREALTYSSNTFFYQIGLTVGPEEIAKWGGQLGIGTTDLGLEGESHGIIPTPAEKEELYGEPWYGGDTVSTSIGQGLVQASPLELAVMVATIANGGYRVHPHLLVSQTNTPETQKQSAGIAPETIAAIRSGLIGAVQEGTAQRLNDGSIPQTAGKTGTAEVIGQQPHALFVGYGPVDNPQIAIAVIVENGGYGGVTALPVAHEVYKVYFNKMKAASK